MAKRLGLLLSVFVVLFLAVFALTRKISFSAATNASADENFPIIDAHTHPFFDGSLDKESHIPKTREEFLSELKEAGVVTAVSMSGGDLHPYEDRSQDHIVQCYGVGPHVNLKKIEKSLKLKRYHCIKIYLGYIPKYAYDPEYLRVYKLAEKYDVPVVFHTGSTLYKDAKLKYADPLTIDEVAVDFPKVTFVIAHLGNPWIQSAAEVVYKNSNVYADISAFLAGDISTKSEEMIEETAIKPIHWAFLYVEDPSKFMFGTDWPLVRIKDYVNVIKKAIPKQYWRAVFFENAARIYKISNSASAQK